MNTDIDSSKTNLEVFHSFFFQLISTVYSIKQKQ